MFHNTYKNKNLIITLFFMAFLIFLSSPVIIAEMFLPEKIHLIKGKEEVFDLNVPVIAAFTPDKAQAFKINEHDPQISAINLKDKFSIISNETGDTEVVLSVFGILPVKKITVATIPDMDVVPCGASVGVRINTDGIMILGTGIVECTDGSELEPAKNLLRAGDLILAIDDIPIESKKQLTETIEKSNGNEIVFKIKRNNETVLIPLKAVKSNEGDTYKMGVWVRDSTQGIGTVTYYNPKSLKFGALGHGIIDVDTKKIMSIKDGKIMASSITSAKKGKKGSPGELVGNIENDNVLGQIKANTTFGIYGYLDEAKKDNFSDESMKIGLQNEIVEGEAYILSTVEGETPKKYKVNVESINKYSNDESRGMIIKITDDRLINKTNGIVQGMSGSPIIQNEMLIGAVTHVFVQDPTKGYGIFIENMIKQEDEF